MLTRLHFDCTYSKDGRDLEPIPILETEPGTFFMWNDYLYFRSTNLVILGKDTLGDDFEIFNGPMFYRVSTGEYLKTPEDYTGTFEEYLETIQVYVIDEAWFAN